MTFPNALTGVKKLYTAEILALIAVIALLLVSLLGLGVKETVNVEEIDAATAARLSSAMPWVSAAAGAAALALLALAALVTITLTGRSSPAKLLKRDQ